MSDSFERWWGDNKERKQPDFHDAIKYFAEEAWKARDAEIANCIALHDITNQAAWSVVEDLKAEIAELRTRLEGRTYCHDNARVEADVKMLANEVLESHESLYPYQHKFGCRSIPTEHEEDCNCDKIYHDCPKCQIARKYKGDV